MKLQGAIAELDEVLQTQEKGIFAGLWIEHTPRFRVVVQLTNGGQDSITPYISGGPLVGLVEVQNASISLEELRATHNDVIKAVQTTGILAESDIDLQTGIIEVYVANRDQLETALSVEGWQLPNNVQIVEVTQLSRPDANWYAGFSLNNCTSGFSVKNSSGTKYSSTAGHCDASARSPLGAPVFILDSGAVDIQVNPQPAGDTIKNWAADNIFDSTPYYRVINAYTPIASQGTAVCKWGKTTTFRCGVVESNNYSYQGTPEWLLINSTNPNLKISCPGDSGGPVYSGGTAMGVHIAGWCDLSNNKSISMRIKGYMDNGYTVMTVP